jgi:hypothetical protein
VHLQAPRQELVGDHLQVEPFQKMCAFIL